MTFLAQSPLSPSPNIGGTIQNYYWNWQGQQYRVIYETLGQGIPVLLLPAFSTVSSRTEMGKIAHQLLGQFQAVVLDWLGFGQSERPSIAYQPSIYHQLLQDFVQSVFTQPITIIAAGHAAGYALQLAQNQPNLVSKLVLVAPTWQGPLRVMGVPQEMRTLLQKMVCSPVLGELLYRLNTHPSFLRWMYSRHVYIDPTKLTPEFINLKWQITQQPNARFAPAAFVTGGIDPAADRSQFLGLLQSVTMPILIIVVAQAPPASKAEMEAMTAIASVQAVRLEGTLGIHEEYPEAVTEKILPFLSNKLS